MDPETPTQRAAPPISMASGPDLVGETFGDFRILRLLGQGGMGRVYLAEQLSLKRKVALKVLREDVAANPTALERFKAESKTVARLSHANIVQVYMVGEHEGRHYMVLEYVEGKSLRDYLLRTGPLDVPLVLSLMRKVASALYRASELGIVHRDVKPENILLTRKAEAKVADFGLSRCLAVEQPVDLTRSGTTVGTPLYMSPEQVEGKVVDCRSDIYSFGVTCYHMLAGHTPFTGSHAFEIAIKHVRDEPVPLETIRPDVPPALCAIIRKMMAKTPQARYQSARDLLKDIARVRASVNGTTGSISVGTIDTETVPAEDAPSAPKVPVRKWPALPRWGLALLALGVLAALGVGLVIVWQRPSTSPAVNAPPPAPPAPGADAPSLPDKVAEGDVNQQHEESLKQLVEQHLKENSPNPGGVEDCIDLGVLYLAQNKVPEAEALFKRMDERRPPSAYHFVGRLGLAVTDALNKDESASHAKFKELFDPKSRDNRVQILNDYLKRNPEFAEWVDGADSQNVRNGASQSPSPPNQHHFPIKWPFHRP